MKKAINVLLLGALLLTTACATNQRLPEDLSGITTTSPVFEVTPEFEDVTISFEVNVPANYFERRVTLNIIPAIKYENGDIQKLPCQSVQGTSVVETLHPIVDWSVDQTIAYKAVVPFQEGMATAILDINGRIYNCLSKAEQIQDIAEYPFIIAMPAYCPPMPKAFGSIEAEGDNVINGKIFFAVNKSDVTKPMTKQPEISHAMNLLSQFIQRSDFNITRIDVVGNASPEGTSRINDPLAQRRAQSTKAYVEKVIKDQGYSKNLDGVWNVTSTQGNGFWTEFYKAVKGSDLENKDAMADRFLELNSDPAEAEKQIKKEMAGNKKVKDLMMPLLRYGSVTVNFDRMSFSDEEVRQYVSENPEILDAKEFVLAAESSEADEAIEVYKKGIDHNPGAWQLYVNLAGIYTSKHDFENAEKNLNTAAKLAPNQDAVNIQRAYMNIEKKDYAAAKACLDNVNNEQADYYRGIVAMYEGNYTEAVDYLKTQPDINLAIAQLNINDVKGAQTTLEGLDQNCPYVKFYESVVYARQNDAQKAKEAREAAYKMDPCIKAKYCSEPPKCEER